MATDIIVPELGESVVEATVARWLKGEGDAVGVGDPLVELETEKVDLEVAASRAGVLKTIARPAGSDVKIGEVLGVIDDETGVAPATVAIDDAEPVAALVDGDGTPPTARRATAPPKARTATRSVAAPGPRVPRPEPVPIPDPAPLANATDQATVPMSIDGPERSALEERVRMSRRRLTIARRLVEVQRTAAILTTFNEVDMSSLLAIRARHRDAFLERHGVGLGISSFFVKAVTLALQAWPRLNAEIQGDEMVLKRYFDIGIAIGASEGLVVPVLRDADRMSFAEIERTIKGFAKKAEDRELTLADLEGGTFTITNGGVFGSMLSTPILNPPQVGILGLHTIADRVVPVDGQVVIRPVMNLALSYDHRLVDGREAVQFLVHVKTVIEDPASLLFGG